MTKPELKVGDKVGYSAAFLRSTATYTGSLPQARGTITKLEPLGECTLATVSWDIEDIPERVLVANLAKVGTSDMYAD